MKRLLVLGTAVVLSLGLLAGCSSTSASSDSVTLKVGATPVPHSELLELVKDDLNEQGITLEIVEFTDYVQPNLALNDGQLDANFFQHLPYLENFNQEHGTDLVTVGGVHVEPMGLYSDKHGDVSALPEGGLIAIPSDGVNGGRALILLEEEGLIKLADDAGLEATEKDIVENPKALKFKAVEAAQLPRILVDVDAAVINGNYALEAGLSPVEDAILLEGSESPYANIVAVKAGSEEDEALVTLIEALQSEEIEGYILENYEGGVVPAFN